MWVTGNMYIDTFLTAGLGCHRVHHLLPYQKSGFANIITVPIVKEVWEEFGMKWEPTRNFVKDRLPVLFKYYILSPPKNWQKDHWIVESISLRGFIAAL